MKLERIRGGRCAEPFPIYETLVDDLLASHERLDADRHPTVAHVLGICAGYAYGDLDTVAMMMTRLGLESSACVEITQTVDAMFIFSTAYVVQSRCGRVVILSYRGTEPAMLGPWVGDADVGSDSLGVGDARMRVHAGFHRNVRATRLAVAAELEHALRGGSLGDPEQTVEHPLEALYVTGHSLGGAMALLFVVTLAELPGGPAIADRLRAVYTFGQPMAVGAPVPKTVEEVGRKVFRHVTARDLVPALPPVAWGPFTHIGREYRYVDGEWRPAEAPVAQLVSLREIPRSLLAFFATEPRRRSFRYSLADHWPHEYIAALRPKDRVTEFGDRP